MMLVLLIVGVIGGGVGLYLVLRNNPKIKSKVDAEVDKIDKKLKK